jgi:hypothetical protein
VNDFMSFLRQMMGGGDTLTGDQAQQLPSADYQGLPEDPTRPDPSVLLRLLFSMQQGADTGRPVRRMSSPLQPFSGGEGGPVNLGGQPDAGDLYDYNYSNGDPGLRGLFGSR